MKNKLTSLHSMITRFGLLLLSLGSIALYLTVCLLLGMAERLAQVAKTIAAHFQITPNVKGAVSPLTHSA